MVKPWGLLVLREAPSLKGVPSQGNELKSGLFCLNKDELGVVGRWDLNETLMAMASPILQVSTQQPFPFFEIR